MGGIGQTLREARESRKISTTKAAAETNIKIQHIEAMEREDFSHMAAPIYAKGFLRLYAEYLGLDPAPLVAEYMEKHAPRTRPPLTPEFESPGGEEQKSREVLWQKIDWQALRDAFMDRSVQLAVTLGIIAVVVGLAWGIARRLNRRVAESSTTSAEKAPIEEEMAGRHPLPLIADPPPPYVEPAANFRREGVYP